MFGVALYNHYLVNIPFPLALFKKLLGIRPTLTDLEELLPCESRSVWLIMLARERLMEVNLCISLMLSYAAIHGIRSLRELLVYEEDVLEELEQDFTVSIVD